MKNSLYSIAVIAFLFTFLKTSAQEQKVSVGVQPAEIIRMGDDLHVFCSGADMNGNGIVESGDVEASWWIFDAATMNVKRSRMLEGGFLKGAPLNVAMNIHSTFLYHDKKIKRFLTANQEFIGIIELPDSLKNITLISRGRSYQSVPDTPQDPSLIEITIYSHGGEINGEAVNYRTVISPNRRETHIDRYNDPIQSFLTSGEEHPQNLSSIEPILLTKKSPQDGLSRLARPISYSFAFAIEIGKGANFMTRNKQAYLGERIYVVMFDDHSIKIIQERDGKLIQTIPTQTTGANGPRECAIDGDNLYVTTYNCDIRKFSISTGELLKIIPISGKADPIQIVNGKLIVGITRTSDSLPNNTISVIDITTSVGEDEPFAIAASVSPNPFKNTASISAAFPAHIYSATIEIFSSSGNSLGIFTKEVTNGELNFPLQSDVLKLAQGQYLARISAGKQMSVVPFVIVK